MDWRGLERRKEMKGGQEERTRRQRSILLLQM